jgi:GNAT superfamily N-acetyltransferase
MISIALANTAAAFADFVRLADEYEDSLPPDLRHTGWRDERSNVATVYGPPNAAFVATSSDAKRVGCVALMRYGEDAAIVKKLYVSSDARGSGAGRALMLAAIREAQQQGLRTVLLDTDRDRLEAAYRLYLSLGFRECPPFATVEYDFPTFMQLALE